MHSIVSLPFSLRKPLAHHKLSYLCFPLAAGKLKSALQIPSCDCPVGMFNACCARPVQTSSIQHEDTATVSCLAISSHGEHMALPLGWLSDVALQHSD